MQAQDHSSFEVRRDRLRPRLDAAGVDAFLTFHGPNRQYLTGFRGSFGFLVVTRAGPDHLVVDWRYEREAATLGDGTRKVALPKGRDVWTFLTERFAELGVRSIAVEGEHVSQAWFERAGGGAVAVSATHGWVEVLRVVKDAAEQAALRRAQRATDEAFSAALEHVRPGATEREVAVALRHAVERAGCENPAAMPIVASGVRGALPHGRASEKRIERGDLVLFDFGAIAEGYHADMSRTVACGRASREQRELYEVVHASFESGVAALEQGARADAAAYACRAVLREAGYGPDEAHGFSAGHGIGLDLHEDPFLDEGNEAALANGMVVTVEPGIYLPDRLGIRIEDSVLLTASGLERLPSTTTELLEV